MSSGSEPLRVNGRAVPLEEIPGPERLLDTLRWRIGLRGTKEGCRSGDCGACTVLVDGHPSLSCLTLTHELEGCDVRTVEGVSDDPLAREVQEAFREAGAVQCGYCSPGFVMALTGLLKEEGTSVPVARLLAGLSGNLCRCTGYRSIVRAVELVRERLP